MPYSTHNQRNWQHDQPTASASAPDSANSIRFSYNNEPASAGGNFQNNSNYFTKIIKLIPFTIYLQERPFMKPHTYTATSQQIQALLRNETTVNLPYLI